jgi:hypothetical protein
MRDPTFAHRMSHGVLRPDCTLSEEPGFLSWIAEVTLPVASSTEVSR